MLARPVLFDAVLFDLDGTLVATDRFWIPAARTGCRRAFAALGLEREPPSAEDWMRMVGLPFEQGLAEVLPDLDSRARELVAAECVAEEHRRLADGGAAPMPGAQALLELLKSAGLRLGIASNCSRAYLEHMLGPGLGLGALIDEARCLDSPGVACKADMIADLLHTFGTRSALFVGDRGTDSEAARENGLPHVHCRFGFAPGGEEPPAQATIEDLGELPRILEGRRAWIEAAFEAGGVLRDLVAKGRPIAVGVTGPPGAGKTLFARDAVKVFAANGIPAAERSLGDFAHGPGRAPERSDPFGSQVDLAALERDVLGPLERGELAALGNPGEPADVLILEGDFLLDPRLRSRLARVLYLDVGEDLQIQRVAARLRPGGSPDDLVALHRGRLPAHRAFAARYPADRHADLVLDASNPFGAANPLGLLGLDPRRGAD